MLSGEQIVALIFFSVIGLCVGSFLNVVIYRLPNGLNLAKPGSHCPKCKAPIRFYDNIPVLSYIILGGKCRKCKTKIPFRYTLVELLNCALWCLCVLLFFEKSIFYTCVLAVTCSVLLCIVFTDIEHMIIPDSLQVALLICAITMIFAEYNDTNTWQLKLIGFVVVGIFALVLHYGPIVLMQREAMGGGDVKLLAIMGLLLGITNSLLAIIVSFASAALVLVIVKLVHKYGKNKEYPFAPFICFGIFITLFFGYQIIDGYLSLFAI